MVAIQLQNELGGNSVLVTVLSDSNKRYLSIDLMKEEKVCEGYYCKEVEFWIIGL
jgi:cysteine synthase